MTAAVTFSLRGDKDALDCGIWWRAHHLNEPNRFDEELERAVVLIGEHPEAAPRGRIRRYRRARVWTMRETGHLLVYRIVSKELVEVIAILVSKQTRTRP